VVCKCANHYDGSVIVLAENADANRSGFPLTRQIDATGSCEVSVFANSIRLSSYGSAAEELVVVITVTRCSLYVCTELCTLTTDQS